VRSLKEEEEEEGKAAVKGESWKGEKGDWEDGESGRGEAGEVVVMLGGEGRLEEDLDREVGVAGSGESR
jgi:hypothetical protein